MCMPSDADKPKIKILRNGPYVVTGKVPLREMIIVQKGKHCEYKEGRELPQAAQYELCRCGKSKDRIFCDGRHAQVAFDGTETASMEPYDKRAEKIEGPALDLLDDGRCGLARFCHREAGSAWKLIEKSDDPVCKQEAIIAASECPTGRLVAVEKDGTQLEPVYEPSIDILRDPGKGVNSGIFVKGNIPIESAEGELYEVRNRVLLCRCGKSITKPFCDALHLI